MTETPNLSYVRTLFDKAWAQRRITSEEHTLFDQVLVYAQTWQDSVGYQKPAKKIQRGVIK